MNDKYTIPVYTILDDILYLMNYRDDVRCAMVNEFERNTVVKFKVVPIMGTVPASKKSSFIIEKINNMTFYSLS